MRIRYSPAIVLLLAACAEGPAPERVTVFAAASTTEVVRQLARSFDTAEVNASFGPTSGLARQIADGAPADVFVSASRDWVEHLAEHGLLAAPARAFAVNRLVCVVAEASPLAASGVASAGDLLARLPAGERIAIADEGVPAGDYARQALASSGLLDPLRSRFVGQPDVRAVLRAVAAGEVAAGFVYATDVRAAAVRELFVFGEASHAPIEYFVAALGGAPSPELAEAFVAHVCGERGRRVLVELGFGVPPR